MKSSYFITKQICTISIDPLDVTLKTFGIDIMHIIQKNKISNVIVNMVYFEIVTSETINFLEKLVDILKLNNVETIVCGFNVESASILFHFVDNIKFNTALDVESALDAIEYK